MPARKPALNLTPVTWVILLGAAAKFALHLIIAPGYGLFFDELYTIALSRHLAFGYVDLPPLVPALLALSRAVLGESPLVMHIVPALAGAATLIFVCLITQAFGGKTFAVALSALGFIFVPLWLGFNSIFCYDGIDQLVLASFLYTLVRFLRSGNRRLWPLLGLIAGIACLTKMTILFVGPGFLVALLISRHRKDLLTPWPWLGALICLAVVSPYLFWQNANHWPTIEYWNNYGTIRVFKASLPQFLTNILVQMNPLLLPLWLAGLYRIFRRLNGVNYAFLGLLFLFTAALMFTLHSAARMLAALFMPLLASGAVFTEEILSGKRWKVGLRALPAAYLLAAGGLILPTSVPILPIEAIYRLPRSVKSIYQSIREANGGSSYAPLLLTGRLGWDAVARDVASIYDQLPAEERAVAGIFTDWYYTAGAIDFYGPQYGLPHAVSGSLNYYLWGPGYSWKVMLIVTGRMNILDVFFETCTRAGPAGTDPPGQFYVFVCKNPKLSAEAIWQTQKSYR
jgi:4-amino-4-deoxy-L-arabinose transferase-like glycosyltransferase